MPNQLPSAVIPTIEAFLKQRSVVPLRRSLELWRSVEAGNGGAEFRLGDWLPIRTRAQFAAGLDALEATWEARGDAATDVTLARTAWKQIETRAMAMMKAYGH